MILEIRLMLHVNYCVKKKPANIFANLLLYVILENIVIVII